MRFTERYGVWLPASIGEHSHGTPSRLLRDIAESMEDAYKTPPWKLSGKFLHGSTLTDSEQTRELKGDLISMIVRRMRSALTQPAFFRDVDSVLSIPETSKKVTSWVIRSNLAVCAVGLTNRRWEPACIALVCSPASTPSPPLSMYRRQRDSERCALYLEPSVVSPLTAGLLPLPHPQFDHCIR